ncbi:MAG: tyrosine-type recombinase/integrase [Myxococcales bacterium]|nr:tyrosine-type recombinase/integrase [Myxococcales bacterium]
MPAYVASVARPPRTLTDAEQALLLKVTGAHRDGFRDHVIFAVALGTGLREHEIAWLNVGDVLADDHVRRRIALRVFKRSTDEPAAQEVFLPDSLWYKVAKFIGWKRAAGENLEPDAPLFVSRLGRRIATRSLRHLFRVWQERAGFDRPFSFHALRHSCLTNAYRRSHDIRLVQRLARHKRVDTTTIYAGPSDEDVLQVVRELPC